MSLPASDVFTGADGTALTTYSANWTLNYGNFAIYSNGLRANGGDANTDACAHWNADAFNNDQYSQVNLVALGASFIGVSCRAAASAATFYGFVVAQTADTTYLSKYVAGTGTSLGTGSGAGLVANDLLRIEANGTSIVAKVNGATHIGPTTDSSITSGSAGVSGNGTGTTARLDNWEGGNLGGSGKTFYLIDAKNSGVENMQLQDGGSPPSTARIITGWIVGTVAATKYALMDSATERASGALGTTVLPNAGPENTLGDSFRSQNLINGAFANANWSLSFQVEGETRSTSTTGGRLRIRIWKSVNANGSGATELTSATLTTTQFTNLANTAFQTITVTWSPGATLTLTNEYLFIQIAFQLDVAGNNANADVHLAVGSSNSIATSVFTPANLTINFAAAALAASGPQLSVVKGAVTKNLAAATLAASGQHLTISTPPPGVQINLTASALAASGPQLDVQPGAISRALLAAALSALGQTITISAPIGGTSINLSAAALAALGQILDVQPGAVSKTLSAAALLASGPQLDVQPGAVSTALGAAVLLVQGQHITISAPPAGAVQVNLGSAILTASGPQADVQPGAMSKILAAAGITTSGPQLDVQPGARSLALSAAALTASGQAITISAPMGPMKISLSAALAVLSGPQLDLQPGAVNLSLAAAILAANGQAITIDAIGDERSNGMRIGMEKGAEKGMAGL